MALKPIDERHALQIQAGALGRKAGHAFEDDLTSKLNSLPMPYQIIDFPEQNKHLFTESPEISVLNYICSRKRLNRIDKITAISTGALATSEDGKQWLDVNGINVNGVTVNGVTVSKCKSDVILILKPNNGNDITVGISTKQCNNKKPTNAQLFFGTATSFCTLLRNNEIKISRKAEKALQQFCGVSGFCPIDYPASLINRQSAYQDRFFWEETDLAGRLELEKLFSDKQDKITRLLLQKAYPNDPYAPDFIVHKTKRAASWDKTEVAIYTVDELIELSKNYAGFNTRSYPEKSRSRNVLKGTTHLAPRFGIIQMQRAGQKKHPTQLQFNLKTGYFYKI